MRSRARTLCVWAALAVGLSGLAAWGQPPLPSPDRSVATQPPQYAPDRVIVKVTPAVADTLSRSGPRSPQLPGSLQAAIAARGVSGARPLFPRLRPDRGGLGAPGRVAEMKARFPQRAARVPAGTRAPDLENIFVLDLAPGSDVPAAAAALRRQPGVVWAEPDALVSLFLVPNDPYFASSGSWGQSYPDLWGLHKMGLEQAWDVTTGGYGVVVAVPDSGLDFMHPELAGRIWTNTDEIPGNGLDDDHNGFVDDVNGWDFVHGDNDPADDLGHGTHVAGTIGAATNNALGVAGLTWRGSVMPIKGLGNTGSGPTSTVAQAVLYAVDNGADIINCSWGGLGHSQTLQDAVDYCYAQGCIVVGAAANYNADARYFSPAGLRDVVCVAASDPNDLRASWSNWGDRVDVSAPGVDILSLRASGTSMGSPVGTYFTRAGGTSMAAPHACGALALLIAAHPSWSIPDLVGQLDGTADDIEGLNPGYAGLIGLGRINVQRALTQAVSAKRISLFDHAIDDSLGDGDGLVETGERIRLTVTLKHFAGASAGLTATLSTTDPDITVVNGVASFGAVSGWRTVENTATPFVFDTSPSCHQAHDIIFALAIAAGSYHRTCELRVPWHVPAPGLTERVSVNRAGEQGNDVAYGSALSADGRFVAFQSLAADLVPGDTNGTWDVFVRDRLAGATERISVSSASAQGNLSSVGPALSADGRFVAFQSLAANLVPGDTNATWDVFVRDRLAGTTERISVSGASEQGNNTSEYPAISADGRFVAFQSAASNLVPGDTNGADRKSVV